MTLRNFLLLGCTMLAVLASPARARDDQADLVHQAAVAEMLAVTHLFESRMGALRLAAAKPGPNQEFLQALLSRMPPGEAMKIHTGVMAPLLNVADARSITRAYLTPLGRTVLAYQAEVERAGPQAGSQVKRTSGQYQAIKQFYATPAVRRFMEVSKQSSQDSQDAMIGWMNRQQEDLFKRAIADMDSYYDAFDIQGPVAPAPFKAAVAGISYVDQWTALLSDTQFRRVSSEWRYVAAVKALGFDTLIAPETLAAPERVLASLAALDQIDRQTELLLTEREKNLDAYYDAALKIEADRQRDGANLVAEMRHQQRMNAQYAAAKIASLGTVRRVLEFARSRKGRLQADKGRLLLASQQDVNAYNAYVDQMRRENQELNEAIGHLNTRRTSWL